jgi:hypothetical protein
VLPCGRGKMPGTRAGLFPEKVLLWREGRGWGIRILHTRFLQYFIQYCFVCRPSDSIVSEDARIEPRTVATSIWPLSRFHPPLSYRTRPSFANRKIEQREVYFWFGLVWKRLVRRTKSICHKETRRKKNMNVYLESKIVVLKKDGFLLSNHF